MNRILLLCSLAVVLAAEAEPTVNLDLRNRPVTEAVQQVAAQLRLTLLVDHRVTARLDAPVTLRVQRQPLREITAWLRRDHGLSVQRDDHVLRIGDADAEDRARRTLRYYRVDHLVQGIPAFPAPDLGVYLPGVTGSRLSSRISDDEVPDLSYLVEQLQLQVTPDAWGASAEIGEFHGMLAITHDEDGHAGVAALLRANEAAMRRQILCTIHVLPPGEIPAAVLDADTTQRVLEQSVPVGSIVLRDGQQNHHYSGIQRAIIADSDAVQSVHQPITAVIVAGLAVDVRVRFTVGGIVAVVHMAMVDPHEDRRTAMRSAENNTELFSLDQPAHRLANAGDTRLVPVGGSALYAAGDHRVALVFTLVE